MLRSSTSTMAAGLNPTTTKHATEPDARRQPGAADRGALSVGLATAATVSAFGQQGLQTIGSNIGRGRFLLATGLKAKAAITETIAQEHLRHRATNLDAPSRLRFAKLDTLGAAKGLTKLQWSKIGRDAIIGATSETVPLSGGTVRIGGKVLTTNGWGASLRWGSKIGVALVGATLLGAGLNFASGVEQGGAAGLIGTYQGRTGALMTAGATLGVGVATFAAFRRRNPAVLDELGNVLKPQQGTWDAFLASDWLQQPKVKIATYAVGYGLGPLTALNLAGGLNFLNTPTAAPPASPSD